MKTRDDCEVKNKDGIFRAIIKNTESDGAIRTVVFELNDEGGWEIVYDSAEENEQDTDGKFRE